MMELIPKMKKLMLQTTLKEYDYFGYLKLTKNLIIKNFLFLD